MIILKNVTKTYPMGESQVAALNSVSTQIQDGDLLAVMGPSGSGKSTLLYTIGGLLTPTQGEVTVNGTSIYKLNSQERAKFRRENIGFIFQTFELMSYLTALENVILPLYLSRVPPSAQEERANEALARVGLAARASHKPTELSGGEQQRVAIARGIVNNSRIILADEPTGNLDQKTGEEIIQLLSELNKKDGLTVIMVTHDVSKANRANRLLEMIDGRVIGGEKNI